VLPASLAVAAIDAGALEFEVRFDVTRFGVSGETLLVAPLLPVLLVTFVAIANPASGALADCAAALVASGERVWAGAMSTVVESAVGDPSTAEVLRRVELTALGLLGAESPGVELLTLGSLDCLTAGGVAVAGAVRGARLLSRMGDCSVGIGVGGNSVVGAEEAGETMLENGAAGTDGDRTVGDWSSTKIVAPAGIAA
jgi:hypothetical protein